MDKTKNNIDFNDWVNTYTNEMFAWLIVRIKNKEIAEDLIQDTFLKAYNALNTYKGNSSPKTWLFSILKNNLYDYFKSNIVKNQVTVNEEDISKFFDENGSWKTNHSPLNWHTTDENLLDNTEFNNTLNKCIDNLPESWASIIRYKYLFNKKSDDICQELNISTSNYWQIIHRAKLKLKNCLEINWFTNEKI